MFSMKSMVLHFQVLRVQAVVVYSVHIWIVATVPSRSVDISKKFGEEFHFIARIFLNRQLCLFEISREVSCCKGAPPVIIRLTE